MALFPVFSKVRGIRDEETPIPLSVCDSHGGLRVNSVEERVNPGGEGAYIEDLALELGCKVGGLPSCYLGLPLGGPFKSRKVRLRLEKIQRDFLWGGGALVQRPHLVRWNLVCLERKKGGLGKQVISHKYGEEEGGWCTRAVSGRYGVRLWKAIKKEQLCLNSRLAYRVGCGRRVRFWKDKWCRDEPLCESFPSLFAISLAKDAWVLDVWSPNDVGDGWTPLFSRAFNDWEIEMVERFMLKIQAFRVQREDEDKVVWTASKSGAFSVKSLYSILEPGGSPLFPCVVFGGRMCLLR
ncbi:putative ribonuclease H protein [Vitis vinifera]|uniref:Putative ribonuclease H protein n=1 Tax=Vitis vinifera TaxID=29760 RepID=A0A438I6F7_VITVI|nr:putative ribonuclease H protein [Vitis vinifera]